MRRFRAALDDAGVRLFTLNGFPYGDFHAAAVKARVYRPDWADPARADYTLRLAEILAACLPDETAEGTVSTLPLGYKPDWTVAKHDAALGHLCELAAALAALKECSGRAVRICLEMEPGCVLETTSQVMTLFVDELPAAAARRGVAAEHLAAHLGVCFDVCHQAVMFEDIGQSLTALCDAGVAVGKIQVSSALAAAAPGDSAVREVLTGFAEPKYLHQVRCRDAAGTLHGVMDLPKALHDQSFPAAWPWRIHFHVPVQSRALCTGLLDTTQASIGAALDFLRDHPARVHPHLEVETYTWRVLPEGLRPRDDGQLVTGLTLELQWLQNELSMRGLLRA
jgi:hypothetical protein